MPPRKKATKGPTPVEATIHQDKRTNLPPAEAQAEAGAIEAAPQIRYPRDPSLDPQLVWRGKDDQDGEDLVVDAPPIYVQERIDPRVLIENLRNTAGGGDDEPEFTLFDTFDGLDDREIVDYYQHDANWSNRMILGDSLQVMTSLAEREALRGKVQMIYIDPPYGIKFGSNWQVSARKRDVADGKIENVTREAEMVKAFRDTWELGIHSYLSYLRDRLEVARDLLTESGSVFLQISDQNEHLVRSVMDEVLGSENFIALIPFRKKTMPFGTSFIEQMADFIIWYAKDRTKAKYRKLFRAEASLGAFNQVELATGERLSKAEVERRLGAVPPDARLWSSKSLEPSGPMASGRYEVDFEGARYTFPANGYAIDEAGMQKLIAARRIVPAGSLLRYVLYADDKPFGDLTAPWADTVGADDKVYVVQTNTEVVKRCMLMTTDPGELVLDPTSGSGTTAFVAEHWARRWIAIDSSRVANAIARQRLMGARFPYFILADSAEGEAKETAVMGGVQDGGAAIAFEEDVRRGFVCERVPHITVKSIAGNPDIRAGMAEDEVRAAIMRHAESDVLVDRPYEDAKKVRVAGPFTSEALSPHRSLAFDAPSEAASVHREGDQFVERVTANLQTAGIQNGKRAERMQFDAIEPYAGTFIQAIGDRREPGDGPARIGIAIGPQYGTVSPAFIRDAAKEAREADGVDLLCVLGFAFDPLAVGATGDGYVSGDDGFDVAAERSLGPLPVLLVRMNSDLHMGDDLKKTGAGNLFTVFGEPDIELRQEGDAWVVEVKGVDVFDPTTGEIRSNDTKQIALWMIDTNYNGEAFFVRHCYFTGDQDPYKRLKVALKADIDAEAWSSLNKTISRPFATPTSGRIAVKVINDYGDEVMKVYEVQ